MHVCVGPECEQDDMVCYSLKVLVCTAGGEQLSLHRILESGVLDAVRTPSSSPMLHNILATAVPKSGAMDGGQLL